MAILGVSRKSHLSPNHPKVKNRTPHPKIRDIDFVQRQVFGVDIIETYGANDFRTEATVWASNLGYSRSLAAISPMSGIGSIYITDSFDLKTSAFQRSFDTKEIRVMADGFKVRFGIPSQSVWRQLNWCAHP